MTAGYSGTPLWKKLGIKPGHEVALVHAPAGFGVEGVTQHGLGGEEPLDVVLLFVTERSVLEDLLGDVRARMAQDGGFWVAWPKKASKVPTDMTEDAVREIALPTGLVDNKVCAIDEIWSGLRLVIRKELRVR